MNEYRISFYGRLKGAIGISYHIIENVEADSEQNAILALYDKYENVNTPVITRVN